MAAKTKSDATEALLHACQRPPRRRVTVVDEQAVLKVLECQSQALLAASVVQDGRVSVVALEGGLARIEPGYGEGGVGVGGVFVKLLRGVEAAFAGGNVAFGAAIFGSLAASVSEGLFEPAHAASDDDRECGARADQRSEAWIKRTRRPRLSSAVASRSSPH